MSAPEQTAPSETETDWRVWAEIGLLSFGGPAAQIALMHREVVERRKWLSEQQFLNATGFCMLLPGPEAMQIATYAGWLRRGVAGGIVAGGLFVLPGAFVIMVLAAAYITLGRLPLVEAVFLGVQAAVIAIVLKALVGLVARACTRTLHWVLAGFGFLALFVLGWPFPLVIALAAAVGAVLVTPEEQQPGPRLTAHKGMMQTLAVWSALWAAPLLALWWYDPQGLLLQVGLFFSKLAIVTFGGAYAVLAYMAQEVVADYGWLSAAQMMDGLGLAETTPGPLILVTQFVGYVAGAGAGGTGLAVAAAMLTLWVTFVPCFLWIFVVAPYVEWVASQPRLKGALQGITAAVVGVIANLSLWFALHVVFDEVAQIDVAGLRPWVPTLASIDPVALGLAVVSVFMLFRLNWSLTWVLAAAAGLALGLHLLGL